MSDKYLLYDRMNHLDESFKYPLNENNDIQHYSNKLNKPNGNDIYTKLSELFIKHNKLTGNLTEDQKILNEFINLSEEEDFDPYAHLRNIDKIDEKKDCVLTISANNVKLDHPFLSLPAGYTCPFADSCKTIVPRDRKKNDGKLVQDQGDLRCYAASEEARYPNAQKMRWRNKDLLDKFDKQGKIDLILNSIKYFEQNNGTMSVFRIHESGDFYDMDYFDAWLEVAKKRPDILFYAYTKSLPFWLKRKTEIPKNLKLVASSGGKFDELISKHNLKNAVVVNSPEDAVKLKLPIDIDDTLAHNYDGNFAILVHGSQKAGTEKSKAATANRGIIKKLKKGDFS
jgi:Gene product 88